MIVRRAADRLKASSQRGQTTRNSSRVASGAAAADASGADHRQRSLAFAKLWEPGNGADA